MASPKPINFLPTGNLNPISLPVGPAIQPKQNSPVPPTVPQPQPSQTPSLPALPSTSSIPLPGQDNLPSDFNDLKKQLGLAPEKQPGLISSLAKGAADIVLQPARALEQLGKFIGTLGLTPEQKQKVDAYLGPGLQEQALGSEYATPTPKTGKQAAGIALQAGANLSVPFGTSALPIAAQGAAYAGGKALEENKSLPEAGFNAALGAGGALALGSILNVGGAVIGRGFRAAAPEIAKVFKPIADKIGPMFTGTTRKEFDMAFKESPHIILDYLNVLKGAQTPAEAEGILQGRLLDNVRTVADKARQIEGEAFKTAVDTFNQAHPDVTVDIHAVGNKLLNELPRFGLPRTADEEFALTQVQKIIQQPREFTVNGARTLLTDLFQFASGLEKGSSAERLAMQAWSDVRDELTKAVSAVGPDGALFEQAMSRYSAFKDALNELKPALNANREDAARSFVKNLAGTSKTAAYEALVKLGDMAGITDTANSIEIYRLMKKLALEGKITGSRTGDIALSAVAPATLGALGSLFGPGGTHLGYTLGSLLTVKALAPSTITQVMLSEIKAAGIPITSELRNALEKVITDPATRQAIINATIKALPSSKNP